MQLLGWDEADVHLRICTDCMHSALWPRFDASLLYGEEGGRVRKEVLASYGETPAVPEKGQGRLDVKKDFLAMSKDLGRFQRVCRYIASTLDGQFENLEDIRVLDWGGGDGYVSTIYAWALEAVTMVKARSYVYDFTEWATNEGNVVGLKDLDRMDKFHVLILSGILEHTHDPVGTLRQASQYLHPGGIVICEVPDERYNLLFALLGRKFGLHYHVCHFDERSLFRTLELAGFEGVRTHLDAASSYRGKPIRFFLGVGRKSHNDIGSGKAPSRIGQLVRLATYGAAGLVRSLKNRMVLRLQHMKKG